MIHGILWNSWNFSKNDWSITEYLAFENIILFHFGVCILFMLQEMTFFIMHTSSDVGNSKCNRIEHVWQQNIYSPYSYCQIKRHSYLIGTIEMRVFWLEIKCLKSATILLNRICVGRQGLDLSKEVLWVSVSQRAAELPASKVGGLEKNSATQPGSKPTRPCWAVLQNFFSNLQLCNLVTQRPFDIKKPTVPL